MRNSTDNEDPAVAEVVAYLLDATEQSPGDFFARVLREAIDQVIDGPRTGRWAFEQLEDAEKAYVEVKVGIHVRSGLELEPGAAVGVEIAGHDVVIMCAADSAWEVPDEAVGQVCLCLGGVRDLDAFSVGVVRARSDLLEDGAERGGRRAFSAAGRVAITTVVDDHPIPAGFIAAMDPFVRNDISSRPTVRDRVITLAQAMPYVPVPRDAIRTLARTVGDPIEHTRPDDDRPDPLDGMVMLGRENDKQIVEALGCRPLAEDEFMSVPKAAVVAVEEALADRG